LQWFILLLPAVLSLLPGMVRACLRVKSLLPESVVSGWVLVTLAPFYSLLLLVVWVAICHLVTDFYLLWGMLLWIAAPLLYAVRGGVLTRPVLCEHDRDRLRRLQIYVNLLLLLAMALLLAFLLTAQVLGMRLVGLDPQTSLVRPWVVVQYVLEYWGRSLFNTVLAADFLMRMNRSIWMAGREFADSPDAADYDRLMRQLDRARYEN
jgi:hypothetical protein